MQKSMMVVGIIVLWS